MVQTTSTLSDRTIERANIIAAITGSLETGIEKSIMAERLIDKMKIQVTSFEYIKKSTGELRRAWGSLAENLMSAKVKGCQRKKLQRPHITTLCDCITCRNGSNNVACMIFRKPTEV